MNNQKGIYLAFEGGEGWGKSTQAKILVGKLGEQFPERKIILTRESEGSPVAEEIRGTILNKRESELEFHRRTREGFLFLAQQEPEKFVVVDGCLGIEAQSKLIWGEFNRRFINPETITELLVYPRVLGKERF